MSRPRTRALTAGLALTVLLVTAVPASAATETFAAAASSAGVSVALAGNDLLEVGATAAAVAPGEAAAAAVPAALGGTPVGERTADSDGAAVADPPEGEDRCLAAAPAPLASLAAAGAVCGEAYAEGDAPVAVAAAGVAELTVLALDGEDLAPVTDLIAELPFDELLATVEAELGAYLDGAFDDVEAVCIAELGPLNVASLLDDVLAALAGASPEEIADILATLGTLLGPAVPAPCDVLGEVADLILGGGLLEAITPGAILDALASADGVLDVTLLETESGAVGDGHEVLAAAGPADGGTIAITVDIPGLEAVLDGLLTDVIEPAITELTAVLAPVSGAVEPVPVVSDLVGALLDGALLADLLDGPLLEVGIAPGGSSAEGDLATGETSGEASPALVALDGSLFALPVLADLDAALNDAARRLDASLLAALRDSALADAVWAQLLPASVVDAEVDGLAGTEATSGAATVRLLGVLTEDADGPLLEVEVAAATAAVGVGADDGDGGGTTPTPGGGEGPEAPAGAPTPVTPSGPTPTRGDLPVTGGGAALLGLAALGAAAGLRRHG